ncbi:MAG TPA: GspMb/PilO family protein [Vicinamibacterales bacterium]|nr:GspMb/PilO family protein [Vicinamibacterales bacterium]
MTLLRRIIAEKRTVIVPLVLALLANIAVYVLIVHPLAVKSESSSDRAAAAAQARQFAERDMAAAEALVRGKSTADEELATFYDKVLPSSYDEARRMTYARLPALARKANMRLTQRQAGLDSETERTAHLGRLRTQMVLEGGYENVRQFLYELETAPEFIIVDDVSLGQTDPSKPLTLTVALSTYYRLDRNGA